MLNEASDRINAYLQSGGLFNPDLAEHDAVHDLLIDCRTELDQLRDRVKELEKALEWLIEAADSASWAANIGTMDNAIEAARRVREGGKVDG